jgi:hypothetical protein
MISIGFADMSPVPHHPMDVVRAAVLKRSVGGAMPQGAHAFSDAIRRGPGSHACDWRAVFSAKTLQCQDSKAMTT